MISPADTGDRWQKMSGMLRQVQGIVILRCAGMTAKTAGMTAKLMMDFTRGMYEC
jgi:hypothetical protein